jgi:dTDP-4-dehydrorhamnose reductase
MDIMVMADLAKQPTQPKYALVVIDTFSKKGEVEPMFNKNSFSVYNALQMIFEKLGCPVTVQSDDDRAFKAEVKHF